MKTRNEQMVEIMHRLEGHLDAKDRKDVFTILGNLSKQSADRAHELDRLGHGPLSSAYAGVALALDVLRELVPAW